MSGPADQWQPCSCPPPFADCPHPPAGPDDTQPEPATLDKAISDAVVASAVARAQERERQRVEFARDAATFIDLGPVGRGDEPST